MPLFGHLLHKKQSKLKVRFASVKDNDNANKLMSAVNNHVPAGSTIKQNALQSY